MTDFKAIDSDAAAPDRPLDTFLLKRSRSNLQAVLEKRQRGAVWTPVALDGSGNSIVPRLCAYEDHACALFPWTVGPYDTELSVVVQHKVGSNVTSGGNEVQLLAEWYTVDGLARGRQSRDSDTADLTGNASTASATTLTLDVTSAQGQIIVILIGVKSYEGTEAEIQDSGGSGTNVFNGWYHGAYILKDAASHTLGSGEQLPTIAVRATIGGSKASDNNPETNIKRQCIRIRDAGSGDGRYTLHVHPPILSASNSVDGVSHEATVSLYQTPLGWLDLHSVNVYVSGVTGIAGPSPRTDAPRTASRYTVAPERVDQARAWFSLARVHALGGRLDLGQNDSVDSNILLEKVQQGQQLNASYATYGVALVGRGDQASQVGITYTRAAYRVTAIFAMSVTDARGGGFKWDIDLRLRLSDWDKTSNTVDVEQSYTDSRAWACAAAPPGLFLPLNNFPDEGRLRGFANQNDQWAHALRGLGPRAIIRDGSITGPLLTPERPGGSALTFVSLPIVDTSDGDRRLLSLQVKSNRSSSREDSSGNTRNDAPRVHLLGFLVEDETFTRYTPLLSDIGA